MGILHRSSRSRSSWASLWLCTFDGSNLLVLAEELSEGELQRLAVARVLFQLPKLAVLDEPFSAMSKAMGQAMLEAIVKSGITVLMTGQVDCHWKQHMDSQLSLTMTGDGSWVLERCSESQQGETA